MKLKFIFMFIFPRGQRRCGGRVIRILGACLLLASALAAQEPSLEDLRKAMEEMRAELARLEAEGGRAERLSELERRIDLLAQELEKARTGGATQAPPPALTGRLGLSPGASKVYGVSKGVSLGGYGEVIYEDFAGKRQDSRPSGMTDRIDALRSVLYLGYKFSEKIHFNSEIEAEHATTGEGPEAKGEVSVEFSYLDFRPRRAFGLRAGLLLIPVGFVNELHEPPITHGARRPLVETLLLPTTWSEGGVGLFGEAGPFAWRGYLVAGLSSRGFTAEGIAEGRQQGSQSKAKDLAASGRLDFTGIPGLLLGASFFTGGSGQGEAVDGVRIGGRVDLFDLHAQYERGGLQLRLLGVHGHVADAALIDLANALQGDRSVGSSQWGAYLQAAYDLATLRPQGSWSVTPFVRYERLDTQGSVPAGFARDPAHERAVLALGLGVKPLPNVVLKADFERQTNKARTGTSQFNLGLGYLF